LINPVTFCILPGSSWFERIRWIISPVSRSQEAHDDRGSNLLNSSVIAAAGIGLFISFVSRPMKWRGDNSSLHVTVPGAAVLGIIAYQSLRSLGIA
jgi:hypothetical protein